MDTSTEKKFYDSCRIVFEKLSPTAGSLITISFPVDMGQEQIQSTTKLLSDLATKFNTTVLILSQGVFMSTMTEKDMNTLGWYKHEKPGADLH